MTRVDEMPHLSSYPSFCPFLQTLAGQLLFGRYTTLLLFCLVLNGLPVNRTADAQIRTDPVPVSNEWRFVGGNWRKAGATLIGSVDDTTRGFAVDEDARLAYTQTADLVVTARKHIGASWSAGGLCLWLNSRNYWRLALAEGPGGSARYPELLLMNQGQGVAERDLSILEREPNVFNWQWGRPYRLRLSLLRDRITGEVLAPDGKRLWHIAYALIDPNLPHFGKPAVGVQGMEAAFRDCKQTVMTDVNPVTCDTLQQGGFGSAWLSLPQSRLVVNPTQSTTAAVPPALTPSLPVHLAYYVGETPIHMPGFWAWYPGLGVRTPIRVGPHAEFTPQRANEWTAERASATFAGSHVRLTVGEAPFGSLRTVATVDLDLTPYLLISVPEADSGWALKVNPGDAAVDTALQPDTSQAGSYIYDIPKITGWHGRRTFQLILFALGSPGNVTSFSDLRFTGESGSLPQLSAKEMTWFPHQIVTRAASATPATKIESVVCLPDEETVAQCLHMEKSAGEPFVLMGQLPAESRAHWDAVRHVLVVEAEGYRVALAVSRPTRWLGTFPSAVDFLAGHVAADNSAGGVWALSMDGLQAGDSVVVAARFAPMPANTEQMSAQVAQVATSQAFEESLRVREAAWNARFAAVPHPLSFALRALDARGATPTAIRRAYYRAWVFLLSDILPPQTENDFPFAQLPCGKPALWTEGAPHARASSQWESVLATQYVALVDSDTAWSAYEGLLSLVSPEGRLAGEGLPSRFAQTAWVLYTLTADRQRLGRIYPALKRLLLWKASDPRWLYKGSTPADQKDAEFVVHALMDMTYAQRIARTLERADEEVFWQDRLDTLAADFHRWFWTEEGRRTYRIFRSATGGREDPEGTWNLQGLVLPPSILRATERETLLRLFHANLHPDQPFLVPALAGFPKYNFTMRGLWQYGAVGDATLMAEAALRDTALAGEFSENYTQSFPPKPTGVMPSLFGAMQIVDAALWRSGIGLGDGLPEVIPQPSVSGLWNLPVRDGAVSIVFDPAANRIEMQGAGLQYLPLPAGYKSTHLPDGTLYRVGPINRDGR